MTHKRTKGKTYFYLGDDGFTHSAVDNGTLVDAYRFTCGNYYEYEEEMPQNNTAVEMAKGIVKSYAKGFRPDFNDETEEKWYILYDYQRQRFIVREKRTKQHLDGIYFPSFGAARNCIENNPEALCLSFGIEYIEEVHNVRKEQETAAAA